MIKKHLKKIHLILCALAVCLTFSNSVFAAELPKENNSVNKNNNQKVIGVYTFEVSEDGISPLSSVGGYNQKSITSTDHALMITCSGSGFGGMGITIETSCSTGTYSINYSGAAYIGAASSISGTMTTNSHVEIHNQWQSDLYEYFITFSTPSNGASYFVKVWIYG